VVEKKKENEKKIFKEFGYDTLVIWESELRNIKKTINKIISFCEEDSNDQRDV